MKSTIFSKGSLYRKDYRIYRSPLSFHLSGPLPVVALETILLDRDPSSRVLEYFDLVCVRRNTLHSFTNYKNIHI